MAVLLSFLEFLAGTFLHFLYDFFPYPFIAIFSATNESVFEHLKLFVYPMLLGYLWIYIFKDIDIKKYMKAMFYGLLSGLLSLLFIYYFVRYGLGIESLVFDILLLLISIIVGNSLSYYVYFHVDTSSWIIYVVAFVLLMILLVLGTFYPLDIPLFQEEKAVETLLQSLIE